MVTAPDIVSAIISRMVFRAFAHHAIDDVENHGLNIDTCKEIRKQRRDIYGIRQSMDAIAADMIMRGEY